MKQLKNSITHIKGGVHVIFSRYSGRLLIFLIMATVVWRGDVFGLGFLEKMLIILCIGSILAVVRTRLLAFIAMVLFMSAPFYYAQGDVPTAEQQVLYAYYLWLLIAVHQIVGPLLSHSRVLKVWATGIHRVEDANYRMSKRAGNWVGKVLYRSGASGYAHLCAVGRFLWRNKIVVASALILFSVPFFWFQHGEADFGGDSSRLYFYDPLHWMRSMAFYQIGPSGYGFEGPNFFLIPFLLLLQGISVLLHHHYEWMLAVFNGILVSVSFLSLYAIIFELVSSQKERRFARTVALLGAWFFIFSQVTAFSWLRYLYTFHQIAVYPLLFLLFLKYIKHNKYWYLLCGLLITLVFSVNFSVYAAPTFFAFFPLALLLLLWYAILHHKVLRWIKGTVLFVAIFLLLHGFQLFPHLVSIFSSDNGVYQAIFTAHGQLGRGLNYFQGVRPMVRLIYNLGGFAQYSLYQQTGASQALLALLFTYGVKFLPLFLLFPVLITCGLLLVIKEKWNQSKGVFFGLVLGFLITLFLMTANVFGALGPAFYAKLFYIPGFSMFRSFYGVFPVIFMFFYALTFGVALSYILEHWRPYAVRRYMLVGLLSLLLLYSAIPFLTGKVVNVVMNDTKGVKLSNKFSPLFEETLQTLRTDPFEGKILTLPLTQYDYQIVEGQYGGAYVGASPFAFLAGRNTFSGLAAFNYGDSESLSQAFALDRLQNNDYRTLNRLFSLLNIQYIFYNSNPYIYRDKFTGWPYSRELFERFPSSADFGALIEQLGYQKVRAAGTYAFYANPSYYIPRIYIPRSLVKLDEKNSLQEVLMHKEDYDGFVAMYRKDRVSDEVWGTLSTALNPWPTVEFQKINPTQYRVQVHDIGQNTPLVFSEAFNPGWKLLLATRSIPPLANFLTREKVFYLPERYHLPVNEYANSWWIDLEYLKKFFPETLHKNENGNYDIDITLAFIPQRYFYIGTGITLLTLLGVFVWLWGAIVMGCMRYRRGLPFTAKVEKNI